MTSPTRSPRKLLPWLAGMLSIIPGLGHIYAGRPARGLIVLAALLAQAGTLVAADLPKAVWWLAIIWLWNITDAARLAAGRNSSLTPAIIIFASLNLIAGWHTSEIWPQIRQVDPVMGLANGRNLVGALANPDLLRTFELQDADAYLLTTGGKAKPSAGTQGRQLTIDTSSMKANGMIEARGQGFIPDTPGELFLRSGGIKKLVDFNTDGAGHFRCVFKNPIQIPGEYWIRAEVKRSLPVTQWRASETLTSCADQMLETVFLAFLGTLISVIISLPLSFLAARNLAGQIPAGAIVYSFTRAAFNVLRSVEVLIIAVLMSIVVGIGPLAGVLALAIHGVGALGKLYSEAIESIEHGPIEAVISTGANWLQVVRFGAVPQVIPQFISFTMYRWDINVRMATVIGLVGGGGIGAQLYSYITGLRWEQAATAIWLIAIVVMLMDYASAVIREKVV